MSYNELSYAQKCTQTLRESIPLFSKIECMDTVFYVGMHEFIKPDEFSGYFFRVLMWYKDNNGVLNSIYFTPEDFHALGIV